MRAVRGGGASNTPTLRVFDPVKVLCIMCLYVCVCLCVHWAGFRPRGGVERTFTLLETSVQNADQCGINYSQKRPTKETSCVYTHSVESTKVKETY
jgi:hypothetical protein